MYQSKQDQDHRQTQRSHLSPYLPHPVKMGSLNINGTVNFNKKVSHLRDSEFDAQGNGHNQG